MRHGICVIGLLLWVGLAKSQDHRCLTPLANINNLLEAGEYEALDRIKDKLGEVDDKQQDVCRATYDFINGIAAFHDGQYQQAEQDLNQAFALYEELKQEQGVIYAAYQLALLYLELEEPQQAIAFLDRAMQGRDGLVNSQLLPRVYDMRALMHRMEGQDDEAMILLKEAAQFAAKEENVDHYSQLLNQISTIYHSSGQVDSAIFFFNKIIEIKQSIGDDMGLLSDYITVGNLHLELGSYQEAQSNLILALKQAENLQDTLSQTSICLDIARVYLDERLLKPAEKYATQAVRLAQQNDIPFHEAQSLVTLGDVHLQFHRKDSALASFQAAAHLYQGLNSKKQLANILVKMAEVENSQPRYIEAKTALTEALQVYQQEQDRIGELNTILALCQVLLKTKDHQSLLPWLNKAEQMAAASQNLSSLEEAHRLKSQHFENLGQYQLALHHYRIHKGIQDSVLNEETALIVQEMDQRFQTEKKDKEIAQQRAKLEQQQNVLREQAFDNILLLIGVLLLLALSAFVIIINRRNRQLNKQRLAALQKERESQVLRAMIKGEEQERVRIARDLHDSLGAVMASAKLRVNTLGHQLPQLKSMDSYHVAEELIDEACHNVREISHDMMPGSLGKYGLQEAIGRMCATIQKSKPNISVSYIPFGLESLDNDIVATNVLRIVQELLRNVIKHAEATEVIVQLTLEDQRLIITVEDDGKGFNKQDEQFQAGLGLESIQTRALSLHGQLELQSSPGEGTTFTITIPISNYGILSKN
ncbi:MAG: tetratricopeptide repeat protein [Saprospiraceae bacterium]|nr:tetratricopeptide repeat protein [Saprospiraceae bacterium]